MTPDHRVRFGPLPAWIVEVRGTTAGDPLPSVLAAMTGAELKVLCAIAIHANARDWTARPGVSRLSEQTGLSLRSIRRATRRLEALGVLAVDGGRGRGHKCTYRLVRKGDTQAPFSEVKKGTGRALLMPEKGTNDAPRPWEHRRRRTEGAASPPVVRESNGESDGAGARLLALFLNRFAEVVGEPYAGGKDALGKWLKGQSRNLGEPECRSRIARWFAVPRDDYDARLLRCRWQSAALIGRGGPPGGGDDLLARRGGEQLAAMEAQT